MVKGLGWMILRIVRTLALGLALLCAGPVGAQDQSEETGTGEIVLEVTQFGVGNLAREGSWVGVLLAVRDLGPGQRNVLLRVRGFDPDGDYLEYDRVVTTNPGVGTGKQSFWLYFRLPYEMDSSRRIDFRAYEAEESDSAEARSDLGFKPGRLLGAVSHPVRSSLLDSSQGLYAVVGTLPMGLNYYQTKPPQSDYPAVSHELTQLASGLTTGGLPDRWQGYEAFDLLLWGGSGRGRDPGGLTTGQATAIREWVRRGGHLVVALPSAGQEWLGSANNPIADLLPTARVARREGVSLEPYRSLLTASPQVALPSEATVHVFTREEGTPLREATPILNGPDGECVVMRREFGVGAVTVIGFDFGVSTFRDTRMNSPRVLPEAEVFWNRVLGRRGSVQATDARSARVPSTAFTPGRRMRVYDGDVAREIAKSGTALRGLVLGVIVFFLFWIIAGPGGYGLLAKYKLKRFAWVAYLGVTAVFTLVAWSGALALRPKAVDVSHLTMTLQVHGSGLEKNRTWASVLIPMYGTARVELDRDQGPGALLSPWEAPMADIVSRQKFPDNRAYRAEARTPDALRVPSRQTVKQFEIDWVGSPRRGQVSVVVPPGDEPRLELVRDAERNWSYVKGELQHDFSVPLQDVKVFVVQGLSRITRNLLPSQSYADVRVYNVSDWAPGAILTLEPVTNPADLNSRIDYYADTSLRKLLLSGENPQTPLDSGGSTADQFTALWLMSQLPPADFVTGKSGTDSNIAIRRMTHGLDVGRWFSRPCVIVIGQLQTSASGAADRAGPVPLKVNGREPPMSGHSVVAWVYPLDASPPDWSQPAGSPAASATSTDGTPTETGDQPPEQDN
ncbi:MAG: hypothetical protein ACI89L_002780 [Phycisphaerales bacterium]